MIDFYDDVRKCTSYSQALDMIGRWLVESQISSYEMGELVVYAYKVFVY